MPNEGNPSGLLGKHGYNKVSFVAGAIEVARTLLGSSIGELIAKALDYIDPWWGFKRNNGYIFNLMRW